ncbi:MAG TPA: thioredoxin domain-containing protein [Candidatus Bathyarchaeia archaeon]|nr:thioredoxin domain-containing protein [Candidatus Bathyarchaeia archaeon]
MKLHRLISVVSVMALLTAWTATAQPPAPSDKGKSPTMNETYPGLASSGLSFAMLSDLPDGVLLRSGSTEMTSKDLNTEVAKAPETMREELKKNGFFLMEQIATKALVLAVARQQAAEANKDIASKSEQEILDDYVQGIVTQVEVTEDEVARFYEENKDACGGATLEQVKDQLKQYVAKEKQQDAFQEHIRTLGQRIPVVVSAAWAKEQAASAKDNPVDKARGSGKPSMVDFGASGCRPCDMMTPILADLKKKYEGKANVLFVHVREEQVLAVRYGIRSIPIQVFFDKDGKEIYRHTGFFPQADIEKKLAELGAV